MQRGCASPGIADARSYGNKDLLKQMVEFTEASYFTDVSPAPQRGDAPRYVFSM